VDKNNLGLTAEVFCQAASAPKLREFAPPGGYCFASPQYF
jgi:hypothetical protein